MTGSAVYCGAAVYTLRRRNPRIRGLHFFFFFSIHSHPWILLLLLLLWRRCNARNAMHESRDAMHKFEHCGDAVLNIALAQLECFYATPTKLPCWFLSHWYFSNSNSLLIYCEAFSSQFLCYLFYFCFSHFNILAGFLSIVWIFSSFNFNLSLNVN